jgi:hypothetical protein
MERDVGTTDRLSARRSAFRGADDDDDDDHDEDDGVACAIWFD